MISVDHRFSISWAFQSTVTLGPKLTIIPTPPMMTTIATGVRCPMGSLFSHHPKIIFASRATEPAGCTTDCGAKLRATASPACDAKKRIRPPTQSGMKYIGRCLRRGLLRSRVSASFCTLAPKLVEAEETTEMIMPM